MFKVTGSDGNTYGLVDTLAAANAVVEMKKTGRDGKRLTNPANATKASTLTFVVSEVPNSTHPGYVKR